MEFESQFVKNTFTLNCKTTSKRILRLWGLLIRSWKKMGLIGKAGNTEEKWELSKVKLSHSEWKKLKQIVKGYSAI